MEFKFQLNYNDEKFAEFLGVGGDKCNAVMKVTHRLSAIANIFHSFTN